MKKYLGEIILVSYFILLIAVLCGLCSCDTQTPEQVNDYVEYSIDTQSAVVTDKETVESLDNYILWVECDRYTGSVFVDVDTYERFDVGDAVVIDIMTDKGNGNKKVKFAY